MPPTSAWAEPSEPRPSSSSRDTERKNVRRRNHSRTTSSPTWPRRWISSRRSFPGKGDVDSDEARERAAGYLTETASVLEAVVSSCLDDIAAAAARLTVSFRQGGTLLICGNGGSAADAQHLATEFISIFFFMIRRPP